MKWGAPAFVSDFLEQICGGHADRKQVSAVLTQRCATAGFESGEMI